MLSEEVLGYDRLGVECACLSLSYSHGLIVEGVLREENDLACACCGVEGRGREGERGFARVGLARFLERETGEGGVGGVGEGVGEGFLAFGILESSFLLLLFLLE